MKMRELPRVEVAPHADVALEPGARHLMLFDPSAR
jgi:copper(I)-binding protein